MKEPTRNATSTPLVDTWWFFWLLAILGIALFVSLICIGAAPFLYCARVSLLTLALFGVALPFLATHNLRSLLLGAYDLNGFQSGQPDSSRDFWAGLAFGLVLVFCGMTIYTTETVTMELGPVRLDNARFFPIPLWVKWILGVLVWVGILVNVWVTWIASTAGKSPRENPTFRGLAVGILAAALIWIGIEACVLKLHGGLAEAVAANGSLPQIRSFLDFVNSQLQYDWLGVSKGVTSQSSTFWLC
jgi:hypothetical protein